MTAEDFLVDGFFFLTFFFLVGVLVLEAVAVADDLLLADDLMEDAPEGIALEDDLEMDAVVIVDCCLMELVGGWVRYFGDVVVGGGGGREWVFIGCRARRRSR